MKIEDSRKSFIQLPHLISAYSRPEYSSTRLSSIIEISVVPLGVVDRDPAVLGQHDHEERDRPSRWVGSTSAYGDAAIAWFIRYGLSEATARRR